MKSLLVLVLIAGALAHFQGSDVLIFTQDDFNTKIQDQKTFYLLLEYSTLESSQAKAYSLAAEALKGFVPVAALHNADAPAPKINAYSNGQALDYTGEWEAQELVNFAFDTIREFAFKRVGKVPKKAGEKEPEATFDESDVIVLTEDTFHEQILNSKDAWFVEFYAPWCGHCKKLAPEWAKLATQLKGEIKVAKIDASGELKFKDQYNVKGFPTIHFFGAGDKIAGDTQLYEGARELQAMVNWARETNAKLKPLYFEKLTSQEQFQTQCVSTTGLCLILFVPDLYECDEECRTKQLDLYRETVKPLKSKPIVHFWSQGGDQYDFEEDFQVSGAGYPSVLALSPKKQLFSKMRGSLSKDNLSKFIDGLLAGKQQVKKYDRLRRIEDVQ